MKASFLITILTTYLNETIYLFFLCLIALLNFSCGEKKSETNNTSEITLQESKIETTTESNVETTLTEEVKEISDNAQDRHLLPVYLNDPDKSGTNIRKTPKGDVAIKIVQKGEDDYYFISLSDVKEGWFKVGEITDIEGNTIEIKDSEGWIHGSVLGVDTRNYGNQTIELLETPESGKVVGTIKEPSYGLKLKDMKGEWIKVEYKGISGWVKREWLCGNPLTTCS